MNFEINVPKKENAGEDAAPINLTATHGLKSVVAVFDGLGGSGSAVYEENGVTRTGAYIASREAREAVNEYFGDWIETENVSVNEELIATLKQKINEKLQAKLALQKFEQTKLKSSLIRTFPTTLALGLVTKKGGDAAIDMLWAGDSRVYALNPVQGLIQLTKDDLKLNNDPFENIERDAPLSNVIYLDDDYTINHYKVSMDYPFFLIAATDGCFGYYPTPMHFEDLLLDSLLQAASADEWKERITAGLEKVSGDDFTLSLRFFSEKDTPFAGIKEPFRERKEKMYCEYMQSIRDIEEEILKLEALKIKQKETHRRLWDKYKEGNYSHFNKATP